MKKSFVTFISLIFLISTFLTCGKPGPAKSDIDTAIHNHHLGQRSALGKEAVDDLGLGKGSGCESLPKNVLWYQVGYTRLSDGPLESYCTNHWDTEILEKWSKGNFAEVKVMYRIMQWTISANRYARTTNECKPGTKTAVIKFVKEQGRWKVENFNEFR